MLRPTLRAALALLTALALPACDSAGGEDQQRFEDAALLTVPSGFTRTDEAGAVVEADASDWQVGPAFGARVRVLQVPFPNPAGADDVVSFTVDVDGLQGGLALYRLRADGVFEPFGTPETAYPDASRPGFYTFRFFGSEATAAGVPGLYRLLLLNGRDRVVTYGDVRIDG